MGRSLRLAPFPAGTDLVIIKSSESSVSFPKESLIVSAVCLRCVQKQGLVAGASLWAPWLLPLQYQECLFLVHALTSGAR